MATITCALNPSAIPNAQREANLSLNNSDILKIDIEEAEFDALTSLNEYTQAHEHEYPIGQMLIELHLFARGGMTLPSFLKWWESLEFRGLRPAWTEPNLLAVTVGLEDKNPRLAEVCAPRKRARLE
jgi:hypothetical protein